MALATAIGATLDVREVNRFLSTPRPPANSFLAKMWAQLKIEGRPLTANQASTSRRIMDQESAAAFMVSLVKIPAFEAAPVEIEPRGRNIGKGIYTVVLDEDTVHPVKRGETWVTFRVKPSRNPRYPDTLEVLTGPDNDRSYTSIGELVMGRLVVWGMRRYPPEWIDGEAAQRVAKREDVARAIPILIGFDASGLAAAGEAWSRSTEVWEGDVLVSVKCYRCGLTLSVPSSIRNGLGDTCASKVDGG